MDNMSPQQQQDDLSRVGGQQEHKRRMTQSCRRQSAPSVVLTKALTRSKTISRESLLVPLCPDSCPLVQSLLSGSDRSFLLHCHAQLKTGLQTQDRHLFLFSDILVVAKAKSANHFKQKAQACVCEMWTAGSIEEVCEGSINPERSFVMGWPTCNCVAIFSSAEQKERWLSLLKSRIKEEKEKEEPKTIPLRVYGKGINSFAITKTVPVSNSDSTNEVIRLALQQFGIIGNVKDYQLWVISKRDNAPYPLIGHEFPFSIQMSHVRHLVSQGGGSGRDAADRQRVLQRQADRHHQFILKPRPLPSQEHTSAESSQKPFKRRRSLINWAFWRGSSSNLSEFSLAGASRGCLFGQPLSSICVEDSLPKPITDMLAFLYHEGSWTRGIFRRPAGARAVRELRDSLDAGMFQLPLTRDHVFIIAGVFKDFLRSVPGSLLSSELYEEWTDVLEEEEEEEEQVQDIQSMICRLPRGNVLLLRHLLAVLHGICDHAHENQMTGFNLSVCIAPSMLWPPGAPCSPEVEGEGTRKVCDLVKFMIEHCQQILGEDPTSLFGGPPQRLSVEEKGSDSWPYPLTDLPYASLENELDDGGSGSPSFRRRRGGLRTKPLQGSLDSFLTFSDNDQDTDPNLPATRAQTTNLGDLKLHRLGRTRGVQRGPDTAVPCSSQDTSGVGTSSTLHSLSLEGQHRWRRCSEPAIKYMAEFPVEDEDGEEEFSKRSDSLTLTRTHSGSQSRRRGCKSESGLCDPTSTAQAPSSLDSLHSLGSGQTQQKKPPQTSFPSTPPTLRSALDPGEHPEQGESPKGSPPKEPLNWGSLIGSKGLHPNSWLKKDRRLSRTQQDDMEKEEEEEKPMEEPGKGKAAGERWGGKQICTIQPKLSCGSSKEGARRGSSSPPSHHHSTGILQCPGSPCFQSSDSQFSLRQLSDIHTKALEEDVHAGNQKNVAESDANEHKLPSYPVFYKKTGPTLSLFKLHKSLSTEEGRKVRLARRRGSEPGQRASALFRARLPSDPELKLSQRDPRGGTPEARFCLSPHTTRAVKDYFSSHPRSRPQSGQQVALALVESHREWLRRCSNPTAEPDFDQLLFAEESYV